MVDDSEVEMELTLDDMPNNVEEITENIRNPRKAIKYIVAIVLVSISITSVTVVSTVNYSCHGNNTTSTTTYSVAYQDIIQNSTLCDIFRIFPVSFDMALTVCEYEGDTRIDIRRFTNDKPSIIGIYLSMNQWTKLLSMSDEINLFIKNPL